MGSFFFKEDFTLSLALTVLWNLTGMQCFNKFAKLYFGNRFTVEKSLHLNDFSMWCDRNDTTCSGLWMMHIASKAEPRVI